MDNDQAPPPGHAWLQIIQRPSQEAGATAIRAFFDATRAMYQQIAFVHETRSVTRTHLEWQGKFAGRDIAGTTILAHNAAGTIESIRLYHRPYEQVIAFSADLARRLAGKVEPQTFADR